MDKRMIILLNGTNLLFKISINLTNEFSFCEKEEFRFNYSYVTTNQDSFFPSDIRFIFQIYITMLFVIFLLLAGGGGVFKQLFKCFLMHEKKPDTSFYTLNFVSSKVSNLHRPIELIFV